jgi:DNA repair exonuclease SbcCD ATPase subunit
MDISALKKELHDLQESVTRSLQRIEYLNNLIASIEQQQQQPKVEPLPQPSIQDTEEDLESSLKFVNRNWTDFKIYQQKLEEIFSKSKSIKDFLNNLYVHIKNILTKHPTALEFIKAKCYPQIKLKMEFQHEKAYNPEIDTATPLFYNEGYHRRDNLIQDITDLDKVIPKILYRCTDR